MFQYFKHKQQEHKYITYKTLATSEAFSSAITSFCLRSTYTRIFRETLMKWIFTGWNLCKTLSKYWRHFCTV